eukprot:3472526-Lingulodinium_polyedra.AAC.1
MLTRPCTEVGAAGNDGAGRPPSRRSCRLPLPSSLPSTVSNWLPLPPVSVTVIEDSDDASGYEQKQS